LAILAVVMPAAISVALIADVPLATEASVLFGCLGVPVANLALAAGRR
jgi:hypothetical protein